MKVLLRHTLDAIDRVWVCVCVLHVCAVCVAHSSTSARMCATGWSSCGWARPLTCWTCWSASWATSAGLSLRCVVAHAQGPCVLVRACLCVSARMRVLEHAMGIECRNELEGCRHAHGMCVVCTSRACVCVCVCVFVSARSTPCA